MDGRVISVVSSAVFCTASHFVNSRQCSESSSVVLRAALCLEQVEAQCPCLMRELTRELLGERDVTHVDVVFSSNATWFFSIE